MRFQKRIDYRVARNQDALTGDSLFQEIGPSPAGGCEMIVGQVRSETPINLFREGGETVQGPQTCFDVPHGHAMIEGGQAGHRAGRGVTLYENHIGSYLRQHRVEALKDARRQPA